MINTETSTAESDFFQVILEVSPVVIYKSSVPSVSPCLFFKMLITEGEIAGAADIV